MNLSLLAFSSAIVTALSVAGEGLHAQTCGTQGTGRWIVDSSSAAVEDPAGVVTWDPDQEGPLPERLVVAGAFRSAGGVPAVNVAGWDGLSWISMGDGLDALYSVRRIVNLLGELVLVGDLSVNGSRVVAARYSNGAWVGMDAPAGTALDAATGQGELLIAGTFTPRGGKNSATLARWSPGTGWTWIGALPSARAVSFYQGAWHASGRTAGGTSTRVTRFDGLEWQSLTDLEENSPWSAVPTGLHAVGDDLWAIGRPTGSGVARACRFESGAWVVREEGAPATANEAFVLNGSLYRAATSALGKPVLIRRGTAAWESVGGELGSAAKGLTQFQGALLAAANAKEGAGPAVLRGSRWEVAGAGFLGRARGAVVWQGLPVTGGTLSWSEGQPAYGLLTRINRRWSGLGGMIQWAGDAPDVTGLVVHGGELVIAGPFVSAAGVPVNNVAGWNGDTWRSMGDTLPVTPLALASDGSTLYVAGLADAAGTGTGTLVSVWRQDGDTWQRLGDPAGTASGSRLLMSVRSGEVFVATTSEPGLPASSTGRVYRFNGGQWSTVGGLGSEPIGSLVSSPLGTFVSGVGSSPVGGMNHLYTVAVGGLAALNVAPYSVSVSRSPWAHVFLWRDALLFSAEFFSQERAALVFPGQGAEAMVQPQGRVQAFVDDGVEGFGYAIVTGQTTQLVRLTCSCGPADVGSTGGTPGGDGLLNSNDLIVFIDLFFARAGRADIGTTGSTPGADGLHDANDVVVYIDAFFAGCD